MIITMEHTALYMMRSGNRKAEVIDRYNSGHVKSIGRINYSVISAQTKNKTQQQQ